MNKVCKEYISDAKNFFPIMGKKERKYLRGIVSELEDCIERENISSKQELYKKYRQPYDLANDYYTRFETDEIVKKIKISKYIKCLISILIVAVILTVSFIIYFLVKDNILVNREAMVGFNQTSTNIYEDKNKDHDIHQGDNYDSMIQSENEEIIDEEEIIE